MNLPDDATRQTRPSSAVDARKTPLRHAADLSFHLLNAVRSAQALEHGLPDERAGGRARQVKEIAARLRRQALELERELVR